MFMVGNHVHGSWQIPIARTRLCLKTYLSVHDKVTEAEIVSAHKGPGVQSARCAGHRRAQHGHHLGVVGGGAAMILDRLGHVLVTCCKSVSRLEVLTLYL